MPPSPSRTAADSLGDATQHDGYTLRSVYQPIFSFSHRRLIGHEGLLRATDPRGRAIAPQAMFDRCSRVDALRRLDRACCLLHATGFAKNSDPAQWLFLNVDASAFDGGDSLASIAPIRATVAEAGLRPNQVVIELLEAALPDGPEFEKWTSELKRIGFIMALDDFGAGHSNFDRVFRLRPHIVKLDRNVIARAALDRSVQRVLARMIALLHGCGAQVLVEGVESGVEANIALDSNADFVQGYHFGRPASVLRRNHEATPEMLDVWASCDYRASVERYSYTQRVAPYVRALRYARSLLVTGCTMTEACAGFLRLQHADLCYLLDADGVQVERSVLHKVPKGEVDLTTETFAPLLECPWRAMVAPAVLQGCARGAWRGAGDAPIPDDAQPGAERHAVGLLRSQRRHAGPGRR